MNEDRGAAWGEWKIARLAKDGDVRSDIRSLLGILAGSELADMSEEELKAAIQKEKDKRIDAEIHV